MGGAGEINAEGTRSIHRASADAPEVPTLAERLITSFRLPYTLGCIVLGFGVFGLFDIFLVHYSSTATIAQALALTFTPQNLAQGLLIAYAFYAPRYMRNKLLETKSSLSALLPDGEDGFRRAFAGISSMRHQTVTWGLFLVALLVALNAGAIAGGPSNIVFNFDSRFSPLEFAATVFDIVSLAAVTLALSSVVWTYFGISRGIRRFGSAALQLQPYYEDAFLGLKPVGSLALSLATVYFGFIALFLVAVVSGGGTPAPAEIVGVGGFLFGLIVLGILFFFVPLTNLHQRMMGEKRAARSALNPKLRTILQDLHGAGPADSSQTLRTDLMDRKVSGMAVWPYDVGILGRLSVIAASVTAILVSRIIALIFHI
jgi:hypothetical protein